MAGGFLLMLIRISIYPRNYAILWPVPNNPAPFGHAVNRTVHNTKYESIRHQETRIHTSIQLPYPWEEVIVTLLTTDGGWSKIRFIKHPNRLSHSDGEWLPKAEIATSWVGPTTEENTSD